MLVFWCFMLIVDLLVPLTMILFGNHFRTKAPKAINSLFGYRTTMSMKNQDTWAFAHQYVGSWWRIAGMILLPLSVLPLFFVLHQSIDTIGLVGSVICMLQLIPMVLSLFATEKALKKVFDKNGQRKNI